MTPQEGTLRQRFLSARASPAPGSVRCSRRAWHTDDSGVDIVVGVLDDDTVDRQPEGGYAASPGPMTYLATPSARATLRENLPSFRNRASTNDGWTSTTRDGAYAPVRKAS